jgi:hypothetical protein
MLGGRYLGGGQKMKYLPLLMDDKTFFAVILDHKEK